MSMTVMKEHGAKWLTSLYDKLQREKTIIIKGVKNVGIMDALNDETTGTLSSDEDDIGPFDDLDSDVSSDKKNE